MTEEEKIVDRPVDKETFSYTYEVNMVIQIFAHDELTAREKLDSEGGYISSRQVNLKDSVCVYSPEVPEVKEPTKAEEA